MKRWFVEMAGLAEYRQRLEKVDALGIEGIEDFFVQREPARMTEDLIGRVDVRGVLLNNPARVEKVTGNTAYQDIVSDFETLKEAGARGVVMVCDSPGGTVEGVPETAEMVASYDLPVVAVTEGLMCSACYYLAAGADVIVATESSTTGSIGAILRWKDDSAFWEKMGVTFGAITNEGADLKGFSFAEMTAEQEQFVRDGMEECAALFHSHVDRHRAEIDAEVWRAGYYGGSRSRELGLVDYVGGETLAFEILREGLQG